MAAQRLTWKDIQEKYPDQWVGLVDIVWQDESNIESAIVKYADKVRKNCLFYKFEMKFLVAIRPQIMYFSWA